MSIGLQNATSQGTPYSFQDAFLSFGRGVLNDSSLTLFSDGCTIGNGSRDCNLACQNTSLIFESTATLYNCLQYPSVITLLSNPALAGESTTVAAELGFSARDSDVATNVTTNIQQCLTSFCSSSPGCSDPGYIQQDADLPAFVCSGSSQGLCYTHTDICNSVYAPVIDDIAGIGIYTSYWMQNGIALVAFALLRLFDFWVYYVLLGLLYCIPGIRNAKAQAEKARRMGLRYRVPNLISALFEFQKAQCFFMIAVQAAAIIVVHGGGFEAKNLQQLSNSYSAITLVAICGYLPVVFTLLNLHGAGKSSWYIIALSTITVIVSGVTAFSTRRFDPSANDLKYLRNLTGSWASCGSKNPTTFCLSSRTVDPFDYVGGVKHSFIFCIIILGLIVLDRLRTTRAFALARNKISDHQALKSTMSRPSKRWTATALSVVSKLSVVPSYYSRMDVIGKKALSDLIYGFIWIIFLFFYCRAIYLLSTWINGQSGVIGPSTWTFGQIVGITIWVPSLIQYLYLETRGMAAWFDQHIAGEHLLVDDDPPAEP